MSKLHSLFALSCVLVFTSAHAPTRMLWPDAAADATEPSVALGAGTSALASGALAAHSAIDETDRFRIDAKHLPELNVDLPNLFDWSDDHQSYYVDAKTFAESQPAALLDTHSGRGYRVAMLEHKRDAGSGGGGRAAFASAKGAAPAPDRSPSGASAGAQERPPIDDDAETIEIIETIAGLTDTPSERVFEDIITDEIITGGTGDGGTTLLTNVEPSATNGAKPQDEGERPSERPIPVPLPGTLFLFALGLGGFQMISRRKK